MHESDNIMNIFVLNCGSSSLKYRMISMPSEVEIFGGEVQRIASKTAEAARIVHRQSDNVRIVPAAARTHKEALSEVLALVRDNASFPPALIAHRFVHGGAVFPANKVLASEDLPLLERTRDLAPVHNPPVLELIAACREMCPEIPQALVLDTAFHSTMPRSAYTYALPADIVSELMIKKYGFHGISHEYVSTEAARFLQIPMGEFNAVSCHLGSGGASLCAIIGGKSVDNSMGFSPLQGLVMSTRSGDIDPAVVLRMLAYSTDDYAKVSGILNKRSGVLGLSGSSSDIRDVISRATVAQDERAQNTLDLYVWRIRKYLGAYLAVVGRPDAVIFTDTIGESVPYVREAVCRNLDCFGVRIDEWKNERVVSNPADISGASSKTKIVVIRTNEEIAIARKAFQLIRIDEAGKSGRSEREESHDPINCLQS